MPYTVFTTPGKLDLSVITLSGVNVKPNTDNPIGYFGTGLKYAIAVLLRHGIELTLYTDGCEYKFYTKSKVIRGKEFQTCRYRRTGIFNKLSYHELPFTTEHGKNWKLWQAFRELMSNTIDEGGTLTVDKDYAIISDNVTKYTYIVVEGEEFANIAQNEYDDIFLPKDKLKLVAANKEVEIYEGNSRYVYYRGLRAYDLKGWEKEAMYTYNYIGHNTKLTEDRTIEHIFYVRDAVAQLICRSEDRKLIGSILKPADRFWEKSFDYGQYYTKSDTFNSVVYRMGSGRASSYMPSSARTYYTDVLRDAPKGPKGLEVSDEIWTTIETTYNQLKVDHEEDEDYVYAFGIFKNQLGTMFNRESSEPEYSEPPKLNVVVTDLPKNLPPGTYTTQIQDVKIEGNKATIETKFLSGEDPDDIPF